MRIVGVIPVRMASIRFPGKPLAQLGDRPLVQWVYEAAAACPDLDEVLIATDSDEIADAAASFGAPVERTRADHASGSDRVAEVASRRPGIDVVVNVQGDQPFVTPQMLAALVAPYRSAHPHPGMTTLGAPLDPADVEDANIVKVVCDVDGHALYFSRAPIPYQRNPHGGPVPVFHHLGLYAYLRTFLETYAQLGPTPLERCEGLEQLRVLEHGYRIRVCRTVSSVLEVNTPQDLAAASALIEGGR